MQLSPPFLSFWLSIDFINVKGIVEVKLTWTDYPIYTHI